MKSKQQAKALDTKAPEPTPDAIIADLRNTNNEMGVIVGKQMEKINAQTALLSCYRAVIADLLITKTRKE